MASILDQLMNQLGGGDTVGQLAGLLGADQESTGRALGDALPALLAGLANNASKPDGAAALANALDRHDGSVLDGLGQGFGGIDLNDGSKILGHVLGDRQTDVAQHIAGKSGLDLGSVMKLLPVLAPLLMGLLGRMKSSNNLGAADLSSMLNEEKSTVQQSNPGLGGLMGMLDLNKDGSVMDDVARLATGGGGSAGGAKGGLLSKILGGFLRR